MTSPAREGAQHALRGRSLSARLLLFALLPLLSACVMQGARLADSAALAAQGQREQLLARQTDWSLLGRLAVSGGEQGGSGRLLWEQRGASMTFEVRAPISRQTWRLLASPGDVRLEGLEGGVRRATDARRLLREEIGWDLPLGSLAAWVRGMRGPGPAQLEFAADGLPALIEQAGWRIEYRGWDRTHSPPLPSRVFASRNGQRVRLAIEKWNEPA